MAPATAKKAKKAKKKNAPDKPVPESLFPDHDKNPVLNPTQSSAEQILKEEKKWDEIVNFFQHQSVSAPLKPPPPALLLTLVGAFLSSYGFNSASRIYTTQLSSRKNLDDWNAELGVKLPKGFPDLVKIFNDWHKDYRERVHLDKTSSEDDDDNNAQTTKSMKKEKKKPKKKTTVAQESSSSSSSSSISSGGSSSSSSDEGEADLKSKSASPAHKVAKKESNSSSSSSSSSTSSSDSDADDEQEVVQKPRSASSSSSSNETSSSSASDSSSPAPTISKTDKKENNQIPSKKPLKEASQGAKKVIKEAAEIVPLRKPPNISTKSSISSTTLEIASPPKPAQAITSNNSSSTSSSDSSSESSSSSSDSPAQPHGAGAPLGSSKRKRSSSPPALEPVAKKSRTPFQRVPKDTKVDARLASNAYVSHEYGDRAHQDLSVTRGKGFTKEKNKKKRGSYRGGAIDIAGGKGIKFED